MDALLYESNGEAKYQAASEILEAREQIAALSLADDEFAEAVGLLFRDDLSNLTFTDENRGNHIIYTIEGGGMLATVRIENGVPLQLSAPSGLIAHGMDGRVPMRWDLAPENTLERGIIIGYLVERKLDGESGFSDICEAPVGIPHMLDDEAAFYGAPVYFEDEVENGRTAQYRLRSLDIFGRMSAYSETVTVEVEKITPPAAPGILELVSADDPPSAEVSEAVSASFTVNNGKSGVAIPITVNSDDTSRIVLYRAVAVGAGGYGEPQILVDLTYEKPAHPAAGGASPPASMGGLTGLLRKIFGAKTVYAASGASYKKFTAKPFVIKGAASAEADQYQIQIYPDIKRRLYGRANHLLLNSDAVNMPDIVFFDDRIEKGASYKYWASAWDETGNESVWSQAAIIVLPDETYVPQTPAGLSIQMLARRLPDLSFNPPGLVEEGLITYNKIAASPSEGIPMRAYDAAINTSLINEADSKGVNIGSFITEAPAPLLPPEIETGYDNLPEDKYIHMIAAVRGEDAAGGSVYLKWPAYGGDGLKGYVIYRPVDYGFTEKQLPWLQTLSRSQLIELCGWKKFGDSFTQNQALITSGLNTAPGSLNIFLICLQPGKTGGSSLLETLTFSQLNNYAGENMIFNEAYIMKNIQSGFINYASQLAADISTANVNAEDDSPAPHAGFVRLAWQQPDDPQLKYYRIYRAEADNFDNPAEGVTLDWTLIGDYLKQPVFSDPVEQTVAHYYYYKVTSVSAWGVEAEDGVVQAFRVPSTKPPETPNIRIPLAAKGGVRVYHSSVPDATKYVLYRLTLPRITQKDIEAFIPPPEEANITPIPFEFFVPSWVTSPEGYLQDMFEDMKNGGWRDPVINPRDRSDMLQGGSILTDSISMQSNSGLNLQHNIHQDIQQGIQQNMQQDMRTIMAGPGAEYTLLGASAAGLPAAVAEIQEETRLNPLTRFKTIAQSDQIALYNEIAAAGIATNADLYKKIVAKFGLLAVANYSDLSVAGLKALNSQWEIITEVPAREEEVNASTGMIEPLFILDDTAEYGVYYLYTIQARNDDLSSQRSEPALATPRRNGPFASLNVFVDAAQPNTIRWNPPRALRDQPGVILTAEQVEVDTIGYIVYRSDYQDGPYYQFSGLLFDTYYNIPRSYGNQWYTDCWYNVKVLDSAGYFSEFGDPIHIINEYPRLTFLTGSLPEGLISIPPLIIIEGDSFTALPGQDFATPYILEGSEPDTVSVEAVNERGAAVNGFTVNSGARTIIAPKNLASGIYTVTATAKNEFGESSDSFTLEVTAAVAPPVITFSNARFATQQGMAFHTAYSLTGSEPITVTAAAKNSAGAAVSGFTVNAAAKTVSAPANLAVGIYTVTATAQNTAGESSATFTLEVTATAAPPVIMFSNARFATQQGAAFQTAYSLTGTEPITVTITAVNQRGGAVAGFAVNIAARTVSAPDNLAVGTYTVTATAKNSAGESSAAFTLEVTAARIAPVIAAERHNYNFSMNEGETLNITISASGSAPISWSLEAADKMPLPFFISIDPSTGALAVTARATAGTYYFVVKAANDAGSDTRLCTLNVIASRVAPRITDTMYEHLMTQGADYEMQFSASGSEPMKWSLEPILALTHIATVPAEASIDDTGKLSIKGTIAVGDYNFIIRVTNSVGSDTFAFTITVQAGRQINIRDIQPDIRKQDHTPQTQDASGMAGISAPAGAEVKLLSFAPETETTPSQTPMTQPAGAQQTAADTLQLEKAEFKGFTLYGINAVQQNNNLYEGTATLDIGCGEQLPVTIKSARFSEIGSALPKMQDGIVSLSEPVTLGEIRLTITDIRIMSANANATVSGYIQSPPRGEASDGGEGIIDFAGGASKFKNAKLTYGKISFSHYNMLDDYVYLSRSDMMRCGRFVFSMIGKGTMTIAMDAALSTGAPWLELEDLRVTMTLPWETLEDSYYYFDNILFSMKESLKFDLQGRIISGKLTFGSEYDYSASVYNYAAGVYDYTSSVYDDDKDKAITACTAQLLVPGGACLWVDYSELNFNNGRIMPNARLKGKLILPFERWTADMDKYPVPPAQYISGHTYYNDVDNLIGYIEGLTGELTDATIDKLITGLKVFGETAQRNGLLLCPSNPSKMGRLAYVNLDINNWDGGGFIMEDAYLSPVNVVERTLGRGENGVLLQRTLGMKLVTTRVTVDMDRGRSSAYAATSAAKMTPSECKEPFWTGLIVKGGTLSLPGGSIRAEDEGSTVDFILREGEMLYDLNGFNYQTYLKSSDEDGAPANFGEDLGSFSNVRIHDCLVDIYNNRTSVEVNCTVPLDVFNGQKVNAKIFSDSVTGAWRCSAAPTEFGPDSFIGGYGIVVDGGWFKTDGVHLNGRMILPELGSQAEVATDDHLSFTDMIIPARKEALNPLSTLYNKNFANMTLNAPVILNFNDFGFTLRHFKLECISKSTEHIWNRITFSGSTLLGESIPLLSQSLDTIVVQSDRYVGMGMRPTNMTVIQPAEVDYDLCVAALQNNFDQSFEFSGVLKPAPKPQPKQSGGGKNRYVEYLPDESEPFSFGFLNSLELLPLEIHARFGYDNVKKRTYYVVGFKTNAPLTIPLGPGTLSDVAGIAASNMVVETDSQRQDRMALSNAKNNMGDFVKNMSPSDDKSTFQAALICKMTIAQICVVDNMYFGFTNGPIVEAGGDLAVALSLKALTGQGGPDNVDTYTNLGNVLLRYDHPNRHFSCNVQFDTEVLGVDIYGNAGFEASPNLLRIYVGYPDYLTGQLELKVFGVLRAKIAIGMGQEYSTGKENGKYFAQYSQKTRYDLAASLNIEIVYVDVSAYAGAEGSFRLSKPTTAELEVYLGGKIVGGIWFFGKRDIIRLGLDAWGNMYAEIGGGSSVYWQLKAKAKVHYGISLGLLGSISGSKTVNMNTSFKI